MVILPLTKIKTLRKMSEVDVYTGDNDETGPAVTKSAAAMQTQMMVRITIIK